MKFNPKFNLAVEQTRQIQNFINEYFEAAAFDFPPVFTVLESSDFRSLCSALVNNITYNNFTSDLK